MCNRRLCRYFASVILVLRKTPMEGLHDTPTERMNTTLELENSAKTCTPKGNKTNRTQIVGNVVYILSTKGEYTPLGVFVNNSRRMTGVEGMGTVTYLTEWREQKMAKRNTLVGVDGNSLGYRLNLAMQVHEQNLKRPYRQIDLARDTAKMLGMEVVQGEAPTVQRQLSKVLNDINATCEYTPIFAHILGVSPVWLSHGIGEMFIAQFKR